MITKEQYFGTKKHSIEHEANSVIFLSRLNSFLYDAAQAGAYHYAIDPDTETQISGAKGGSGDGGYRTPDSSTGAKNSKHKDGHGGDVTDQARELCAFAVLHPEALEKHGLYIEDPRWTPVWLHAQDVAPSSGQRIYRPSMSPPLAPALPGQKEL
jgi:hypothetical protein